MTPDLTLDSSTNIFAADYFNHRIQKLDKDGKYITKFGAFGTGDGFFQNPFSVAVDGQGNLYVSDTGNNRVQKFSGAGKYIWKVGGDFGASGDLEQFDTPQGIALDRNANVFVADRKNGRVQKFDTNLNYMTNFTADIWGDQQASEITYVKLDDVGNIYLAEQTNNRVVVLTPTSVLETPRISSISPSSVTARNPSFVLNVAGSNFTPQSKIQWNGSTTDLTTNYLSPFTLATTVPASFIATASNNTITVLNSDGQVSNKATLQVKSVVNNEPGKLGIVRIPAPTLVRDGARVTISGFLQNTGGAVAQNVKITGARLRSATSTSALPRTIGNINSGATAAFSLTFPSNEIPATGRLFLYVNYTSANSGSGVFSVAVQ